MPRLFRNVKLRHELISPEIITILQTSACRLDRHIGHIDVTYTT
jgi:hypothetical protein